MSIISRVFLEHNAFLKKFLKRFMSSEQDIEDIVQEVYIKAHHAEQEKEIIEQPKAFLFKIAKNLALDELNKKSRLVTSYIEDCIAAIPVEKTASMESEVEANESLTLYCEAIELLPEKCKQIYLMRKVYGLKHKEIAAELDISLSSVEKHLKLGGAFCQQYMSNKKSPVSAVADNVSELRKRNF
ncbi:RNA polymerase sigma factor [Catenovulum sp. 2E275]|uniref:RNA polymerase sigma factor n=1 Tax=Catenovulum sp. 2E275 TaxID=2980497 RepID=UPI0021D0E949|nr:RNA polymerase sigma factor [Catenovulum sp. 2E275]MCU4677297.1 RNA polymerase sigma factor [Catenovulum sp. 2E275]